MVGPSGGLFFDEIGVQGELANQWIEPPQT